MSTPQGTLPRADMRVSDLVFGHAMRLRNSAVSEFIYTAQRHVLLTFNTLPHLDHPDHASWITFA